MLIASGWSPSASACAAVDQAKLPQPWPMSNRTPRAAAACASGRTRPSSPRMPGPEAVKAWVTMSPGRSRREGRSDVGTLGDVGHQTDAGQIGRLQGGVERGGHVVAAGLAAETDLDPDDDVPMLQRDGGRLARARVPNVLELADDAS